MSLPLTPPPHSPCRNRLAKSDNKARRLRRLQERRLGAACEVSKAPRAPAACASDSACDTAPGQPDPFLAWLTLVLLRRRSSGSVGPTSRSSPGRPWDLKYHLPEKGKVCRMTGVQAYMGSKLFDDAEPPPRAVARQQADFISASLAVRRPCLSSGCCLRCYAYRGCSFCRAGWPASHL